MKANQKLREVVLAKLPKGFRDKSRITLEDTSVPALKSLRVVTEAWKSKSRGDRIERVATALEEIPLPERAHIISVGVFTAEELAERKAFTREVNAIFPDQQAKVKVMNSSPKARRKAVLVGA